MYLILQILTFILMGFIAHSLLLFAFCGVYKLISYLFNN